MSKRITLLGLSVFAFAFITSCATTGEEKHPGSSAALYYQGETKVDTDEYNFLRSVYKSAAHEIEFARIIEEKGSSAEVKSLAKKISDQYKKIQTEVSEIGKQGNILLPYPAMGKFELPHGLDSAQGPTLEKAYIEHSLHNQESVIHQFTVVEENTKKSTRDYARATLPSLEKTLEETKAIL